MSESKQTILPLLETSPKPNIFFILGGPGSGKGTLCDQMVKVLGFQHFSTGDLLRKELEEHPESGFALTLRALMTEGKLVSSDLLLDLLIEKIKELKGPNVNILLDGFPRNQENLEMWKQKKLDIEFDVKAAVFLDCCFATMENNVIERAKTSGRDDDNIETIRKRIKTFEVHTKPLLEMFEKEKKIIKVDAEKSPDDIFKNVIEKFEERNIVIY